MHELLYMPVDISSSRKIDFIIALFSGRANLFYIKTKYLIFVKNIFLVKTKKLNSNSEITRISWKDIKGSKWKLSGSGFNRREKHESGSDL